MKGIVFNLLAEVVAQEYGENTWDQLLSTCGLSGSYTSLGNYPDEEMGRLVGAASQALHLPPEAVLRWFGRKAMPRLAVYRPGFFEAHKSTQPFLKTLNTIIHPEVRKLYPGADVPEFDFGVTPAGALEMGYRSPRKLCALAKGFIEGAADHYREMAIIDEPQCMLHGADRCVLHIAFAPLS